MAWEFVVDLATPLVSIVAILSTSRTANRSIKQQLAMAEAERGHQAALSHEERLREWRGPAYLDILNAFLRYLRMMEAIEPTMLLDPALKAPVVTEEDQILTTAKTKAYGSTEVQGIAARWFKAWVNFDSAVWLYRKMKQDFPDDVPYRPSQVTDRYGISDFEQLKKINDLRAEMRACVEQLADQINSELTEYRGREPVAGEGPTGGGMVPQTS